MFTRAHQVENPGAGVGLAIVRRIVENHQGQVWIESGVGSGTTVSFTLPQGEWGRVCAIA
jgi:signal transduction histidine kinase